MVTLRIPIETTAVLFRLQILVMRGDKAPPTPVTSARFYVASFEVDTAKRKEVEEKDCSACAVARRPSFITFRVSSTL
ncbi:hypothetical protein AVEN_247380-1 [Araneus ventricosus]|uniref:Uncharacterized protein n=1 Tax=Araneus ventricosus TaxID=182803 RepID=A0A4Y2BAZ9_ARAVE|nr:hypothetical protein AVEN_247380-1 [Araneus ventricosus]